MTLQEVMTELETYGDSNIKKILLKHGIKEPFFGVKIEHLKLIQKKIKKDYSLSLELFKTQNADAMYLAGLIADDDKMTQEDLRDWVKMAYSPNISEYTVPWVCAGGPFGYELGMEWIESKEEHIASAGWATLSCWVAKTSDDLLNIPTFQSLLKRVEQNIHTANNREKSAMNLFIISLGSYVTTLTQEAKNTALRIGNVTIDKNGTACKTPNAVEYIDKMINKNLIGKKKKTLKC